MPDLANNFSNDTILMVLSKNNGDINKAEEYLFEYLVEYQKKNKWFNILKECLYLKNNICLWNLF